MANIQTSMYFVDDGGRVEFSDGPDKRFTFGTGDWTIEFWGQTTDTSSPATGWFNYFKDSNNRFHLSNYSNLDFYCVVGGTAENCSFTNARDLLWHHYAVVRNGNHLGIWIDGVLTGSNSSYTLDMSFSGGTFYLGIRTDNGSDFTAYSEDVYMDEFRVSKGLARYGNIEPPTTQLKTWQTAGRGQNTLLPHHTRLLIQSNSTMTTSDSIIDQSGHNTISATSVTVSQGQTNFGNTAFLFDSGDAYLSYTSDGSDHIGSHEFSYEQWIYPTSLSTWTCYFVQDGTGDGTEKGLMLGSTGTSSTIALEYNNNDNGTYEPHATGIIANAWQHVVHARVDGVLCAWVNGVLKDMTTTGGTTAINNPSGETVQIGHGDNGFTNDFDGYMDGIRLCVGQSAYTPNFTPYGGLKNLAVNKGGAVTDVGHPSANTQAIQMGRAAIGSDAATNANTYHLHFDGTADYLLRNIPAWNSADSQGTIVAWIYNDDVSGDEVIFSSSDTAGTTTYLQLLMSGANIEVNQKNGDTEDSITGGTTLSASTWYMVAVTSTGSAYALYVNGAAESLTVNTGSNGGDWLSDTSSAARDNISIGVRKDDTPDLFFDGRIMQVAYFGGSSGTTGVLSAAQLLALNNAGKGFDFTGATGVYTATEIAALKGYWRMGNHYLDTAETIYDASGNGYDMHAVSAPNANTATGTNDTTFIPNWQHRGQFTPDKYTSLLIQSSTREGAVTFEDTGPGFKKTLFDGSDDRAHKTSLTNYRSSDTVGSIVAWVNPAAAKDNNAIFCYADTAAGSNYFYLSLISTNKVNFQPVVSASSRGGYFTGGSVPPGKWAMVALTYDDTQYRIYVDGVEVTTTNGLTGSPDGSETWFNDLGSGVFDAICVGALLRNTDVHEFNGQIAGVGVWSSTLTASQISAMHDLGPGGNWKTDYSSGLVDYWTFGNQIGEGTDTAATIYSQVASGNDLTTSGTMAVPYSGHTVSGSGTINHTTTHSVVGGSSINFTGSSSYIDVPSSPDFNMGTGDFTMEMWINPHTSISWDNRGFMSLGTSINGTGTFGIRGSGTGLQVKGNGSTLGGNLGGITATEHQMSIGSWSHMIAQRRDGITEVYIDGIIVGSDTTAYTLTQQNVRIGYYYESAYYGRFYADEIRITQGIARYSPSIERFANTFVAKGDTGDAFTYLQLNSNGAKNGAVYNDHTNRTGFGTTIMTVGAGEPMWKNTKGDPYGGANTALYFDGTSYLTMADNTNHDFAAADDATFEIWVNFDDVSATKHIFGCGGEGNSGNPDGWSFRFNTSGTYSTHGFYMNLDWASPYTITATGPADNEYKVADKWYHCAITKKGTAWSLYTDGVLKSSMNYAPAVNTATAFRLGYAHDGHAPNSFKGYIDGFRISRGIARYGDFSLRTAQQVVTSSNSDSGVITSNSTFGTGDNAFTTDSYTAILVTGDENFGGTATATISIGGSGPGPVSSGTLTLTNNSTATQRRGFSAFGANSYFIDGTDTDEGLYVQMSNNTALANLHSFTVEGWYKITFSANRFMWTAQYDSTDAWDYDMIGSYHESAILLRTNWDVSGTSGNYVNVETGAHSDNKWHHFAWQYDFNSTPYPTVQTIIDGRVIDSSVSSDMTTGNKDYKNGKFWIGNGGDIARAMYGYVDSWRFSANILRYNYTGTNTKLGINAVHHSNCKLLVTSNTVTGNTHFDDFSDQGNYWNQTPYNYFFSRAPYLKNVNAGNMARSIMDSDVAGSIAAWVMIRPGATMSQKTIISFTDTGAADQYFQFDVNEQVSGKHILSIGEVYNGSAQSNILGTSVPIEEGTWYLAGCVSTGTAYKLYLNGIDIGGTTSGTQGDWVSDCNGDGGLDNVNVGELMRSSGGGEWDGRIAQVAVWGNTSDTAQGGAGVLSTAQFQAMYEAGPTANWTTDYQTNMRLYYAMGNHNSLGGGGADTGDICYDRSGNAIDLTIGDGNAIYSPHKGELVLPSGAVKHFADVNNFGSSSIFFDGADDFLVVQSTKIGDFGDDVHAGSFTMEVWLKATGHEAGGSGTAGRMGIASRRASGQSSSTAGGWFWDINDGRMQLGGYFGSEGWLHGGGATHPDCTYPTDQGWHHCVVQRVGDANSNPHYYQMFIDGILQTSFPKDGTGGNFLRGQDSDKLAIGNNAYNNEANADFEGYMDEFAVYTTAKYNTVATGLGTATITPSYLPDPTGNHFTTSGIAESDQMIDTPENNFCTFNAVAAYSRTFTEGSLAHTGTTANDFAIASMAFTKGKWYHEVKASGTHGATNSRMGFYQYTGKEQYQSQQGAGAFGDYGATVYYLGGDNFILGTDTDATYVTYSVTHADAAGDVYMFAMDLDDPDGKCWFGVNGVWFAGNPAKGEDPPVSSQRLKDPLGNMGFPGAPWTFAQYVTDNSITATVHANFGQGDPDGGNNYTDSKGIGGFRYEPPSGFLSWCTANMKDED